MQSLLGYGADTRRKIKRAPRDGYTPLHISADNIEIASILVEVGAPVQESERMETRRRIFLLKLAIMRFQGS